MMKRYRITGWLFLGVAIGCGLFFSMAMAQNQTRCMPTEPNLNRTDDYGYHIAPICEEAISNNTKPNWQRCVTESSCPVLVAENQDEFCRIQLPGAEPEWFKVRNLGGLPPSATRKIAVGRRPIKSA